MTASISQSIELIAHRGLWVDRKERNTPQALFAALAAGMGIETDIRDANGVLVISHDMPSGNEQTLDNLLSEYRRINASGTLALNIKSDGLANHVLHLVSKYEVQHYFCFDMSIPDSMSYRRLKMPIFDRLSEYEKETPLTETASGIWLDAFQGDWFQEEDFVKPILRGQDVCVVSPELHNRPPEGVWEIIRSWQERWDHTEVQHRSNVGRLMVCTDFPSKIEKQLCL